MGENLCVNSCAGEFRVFYMNCLTFTVKYDMGDKAVWVVKEDCFADVGVVHGEEYSMKWKKRILTAKKYLILLTGAATPPC